MDDRNNQLRDYLIRKLNEKRGLEITVYGHSSWDTNNITYWANIGVKYSLGEFWSGDMQDDVLELMHEFLREREVA